MLLKSCATPPASWPNRLHLGRLRDLALELGFLAIVLEQQENAGLTKVAEARDSQRDRLARLVRQANGKVARHRRAAAVAAHRIGHRGLVFLDHQVARKGGKRLVLVKRSGTAERLVAGEEPSVAVDQCKAKRKQVEQGLQAGGLGQAWRFTSCEQQGEASRLSGSRLDRNVQQAQQRAFLPFGSEADAAVPCVLKQGRQPASPVEAVAGATLNKGLAAIT
jgi:hypothetical protein